jgi:hypothetical protein
MIRLDGYIMKIMEENFEEDYKFIRRGINEKVGTLHCISKEII